MPRRRAGDRGIGLRAPECSTDAWPILPEQGCPEPPGESTRSGDAGERLEQRERGEHVGREIDRGATAVCDRAAADGVPVILGEFGQHSDAVIDDTLQSNVTATFLSTARSLCFAAAIAWRYDYGPSCWDFVREDGSFRPAVSIMQAYGALP